MKERRMEQVLNTLVLIPSLHPNHLLTEYVDNLTKAGFTRILIVDDGSGPDRKYQDIFEEINSRDNCTVIGYRENHGKGYALKHGMAYIQQHFPDAPGVVTADSDGQHTAEDVMKLATRLQEKQDSLLVGSRDFSSRNKDIPFKSRAGNRLTSFFYLLLYGQWLPDTQTGLRAFSPKLIPFMMSIPGDRFEYEMNMLIHCSGEKVPFDIVPIDTIYIEDNKSSHFRAFHDSARIYKQLFGNFFRYTSSSILSALLDLLIFIVLDKWVLGLFVGDLLKKTAFRNGYLHVFAAKGIARVCSSIFNYKVNQKYVFGDASQGTSAWRYALLAVINVVVSSFVIAEINSLLGIDNAILAVITDTILYIINYRIQKAWVFKK